MASSTPLSCLHRLNVAEALSRTLFVRGLNMENFIPSGFRRASESPTLTVTTWIGDLVCRDNVVVALLAIWG